MSEAIERFDCLGSSCVVCVIGDGERSSAAQAAAMAHRELRGWHAQFSRFLPDSELSRWNRDPRGQIEVSRMMALLAQAALTAGALSDGLVDATQLQEIERAGYEGDLAAPVALQTLFELAPSRTPARADPRGRWRLLEVDIPRSALRRPPGVGLDSGGLAKGLFADVLAERLAGRAELRGQLRRGSGARRLGVPGASGRGPEPL